MAKIRDNTVFSFQVQLQIEMVCNTNLSWIEGKSQVSTLVSEEYRNVIVVVDF